MKILLDECFPSVSEITCPVMSANPLDTLVSEDSRTAISSQPQKPPNSMWCSLSDCFLGGCPWDAIVMVDTAEIEKEVGSMAY